VNPKENLKIQVNKIPPFFTTQALPVPMSMYKSLPAHMGTQMICDCLIQGVLGFFGQKDGIPWNNFAKRLITNAFLVCS
jgi:hypothetical protein